MLLDQILASAAFDTVFRSENNDTNPNTTRMIAISSSSHAGRSCSILPIRSGSSQGWNSGSAGISRRGFEAGRDSALTNFGALGSAERCDAGRGIFAAAGLDAIVLGMLEGLLFGLLDFV